MGSAARASQGAACCDLQPAVFASRVGLCFQAVLCHGCDMQLGFVVCGATDHEHCSPPPPMGTLFVNLDALV